MNRQFYKSIMSLWPKSHTTICCTDPLCAGIFWGVTDCRGTNSLHHKREHSSACYFFHDSAPLQTSNSPTEPKKRRCFEFLLVFDEWVFPPKSTHEYGVAGPRWSRLASPLFRVTSDEFPCGGSGVDSGGHHNASFLHKPGTFVFWGEAMQNSLFSPCEDRGWINIFEAQRRGALPSCCFVLEHFSCIFPSCPPITLQGTMDDSNTVYWSLLPNQS